jgi:3-oxoacyl-[acyl-carrier-protein] synthase-1
VGGVDSLIDLELLGLLDQEDRVQRESVTDGFVPGEGAAFLLLGARQTLQASSALASITAPGTGQEKGHYYSRDPYLGDGLADAIRVAVERAGVASIRTVLSSLNGESFGAKEWGTAAIRNNDAFHRSLRLEAPADCFGDLGAAIGPVLVTLAALGMAKGYLPAPSMVWCSSELTSRAATVVLPLAGAQ